MYQRVPKFHYTKKEEVDLLNCIHGANNEYDCNSNAKYESLNKNLSSHLTTLKNGIEINKSMWEKYRNITNPYEFINTSIPNNNGRSVCKLTPLSRSFYKMVEIVNTFNLVKEFPNNINSYHLAEGPGGFIEAISYIRMNMRDNYYGMTLIDESNSAIPGWRKSKNFIIRNPNVVIEKGYDGTGDLTNLDNLVDCYARHKSSMDIITADGGFDFSSDFNNQETTSLSLIICQIAFAISMQKKGGHFVIKVFDTFKKASIDLVYILSFLYEEVYFIKPNTSRYTNSEKYIVCKYFRLEDSDGWVKAFYHMAKKTVKPEIYCPIRILSYDIPNYFIGSVNEINYIFGHQQIQHMLLTFQIINANESICKYKNENIKKCVEWCKKNNLPFHKSFKITSN
jgi:23S rRNA U2552 (ribose-2'-O)-methylase RlmE/FtsJ